MQSRAAGARPVGDGFSFRDLALNRRAIARVLYPRAHWLDPGSRSDLVSEVVVELLERHSRQPERRFPKPWAAIHFAVLEAWRRWLRSYLPPRAGGDVTEIDLAEPCWLLEREALAERIEDEANEEAWRAWQRLTRDQRRSLALEADLALGTSISTKELPRSGPVKRRRRS